MFKTIFTVIILFFSTMIFTNLAFASGHVTKIHTTLTVGMIQNIDLSTGTFKVNAEITQKWKDNGTINKHLGFPTTKMILSDDQINKLNLMTKLPNFLIANSNEPRTTLIRTMMVKPDGVIELFERFSSINRIYNKFPEYPFGKLTLSIPIEASTMQIDEIVFVNSKLNFESQEHMSEGSHPVIQNLLDHAWSKVGQSFLERNIKSHHNLGETVGFSRIDYHIIVVRKLSHDLLNIFLPFGIIVFFSFMINWFCPIIYGSNSDHRISGQLTLLLTIQALKFSLSDAIPDMDHLNFIDAIIASSSTIITIALASGVYVNYINYTAPTKVARIDKLTNLLLLITAILTGCWCVTFIL
jgi:hypothetical protein